MISGKFNRPSFLLKKKIKDIHCKVDCHWYIAGGAVRAVFANEPIKDIDIFFFSEADYNKFKSNVIIGDLDSNDPAFETDSAISYNYKGMNYQLIKKMFGTPEFILNNFDFTVCMGLYSPEENNFLLHDNFLEDLSCRILYYNIESKFPIASIYRMKKYINKGYQVPAIEILKLALRANNISIKTLKELKEQLDGIDTLLFKDITDKLMENAEKEYDFRNFIGLANDVLTKTFNNEEEDV